MLDHCTSKDKIYSWSLRVYNSSRKNVQIYTCPYFKAGYGKHCKKNTYAKASLELQSRVLGKRKQKMPHVWVGFEVVLTG